MLIFVKYNKKLLTKLTKKEFRNAILAVLIIFTLVVVLKHSGLSKYFNIEEIENLKNHIENYGILGYFIYILINVITAFVGFPVVIIKFIGGMIFGPILGTLLISIGSIIGAALSFLSARYIARNFARRIVAKKVNFQKIYDGVEKNSWKMIMITRLIPIFPYSFQNYVYGITEIRLSTYILSTFIFMLPSNFGIVYLAHSALNDKNILFAILIYVITVIVFGTVGLIFYPNQSRNIDEQENPIDLDEDSSQ